VERRTASGCGEGVDVSPKCEDDTYVRPVEELGKDEEKGLEANIRGEPWKKKWMTL
jgi:hypothetical protein